VNAPCSEISILSSNFDDSSASNHHLLGDRHSTVKSIVIILGMKVGYACSFQKVKECTSYCLIKRTFFPITIVISSQITFGKHLRICFHQKLKMLSLQAYFLDAKSTPFFFFYINS